MCLHNAGSIHDPRGTDAREIYDVAEEPSQYSNICFFPSHLVSHYSPWLRDSQHPDTVNGGHAPYIYERGTVQSLPQGRDREGYRPLRGNPQDSIPFDWHYEQFWDHYGMAELFFTKAGSMTRMLMSNVPNRIRATTRTSWVAQYISGLGFGVDNAGPEKRGRRLCVPSKLMRKSGLR